MNRDRVINRWLPWGVLYFLAAFSVAWAANPVSQSGTVTNGHASVWVQSGIIGDGGPATNGNLTELGVFKNGGLPLCVTASTVAKASFNPGSSPYTQLCLTATQGTLGGLTLNSYNGAASAAFNININGTNYAFPASGSGTGNVTGPSVSVVGDLAIFNSTNGQLLADGGTGSTFGGTVTVFTGTGAVTVTTSQKIIVVKKTVPATTSVVLPAASNWPNCPSSANTCPIYRIKDGSGNAGTYHITITAADSANIDGTASFTEMLNYQSVDLLFNGTQWNAL